MILAIAILASIAAIATAPPAATLCVGDTCRVVDDAGVRVVPADVPRPFVWISGDGARVIAGVIPGAAALVPLSEKERVAHTLALATSDGARKVAPAFALHCGSQEWKWSQPDLPRVALEVLHPGGPCTLQVRSDGYQAVEKPLTDAVAGTVYLHRLPVISGAITDATTQVPIDRAEVLLPTGERLAMSNADGRFRAAIDGPWPSQIRIEAPGRATRIITVPKAVADTHLQVALSIGGSIALALAPPLGEEEVSWEVRRIIDRWKDEVVRIGRISAGESKVLIDALEGGSYRIVLKGEGPLQRFATSVEVSDGATAEAVVRIEPARLELLITRGGEPFGDAKLEISFNHGAWRSSVSVDDRGEAAEEIWQRGEYAVGINTWRETKELRADGTLRWTLAIPDRAIRGHITDAATGRPVVDAAVVLDASFGMTTEKTAADGSYEFKMLPTGSYSLSVQAGGYQPLRTPRALLAEETRLEVLDLALHAPTGRTMRAVTALGVPVTPAFVYVSTRTGARPAGLTDADGRVVLPVAASEHGSLFVLPRSGSLGVTRFGPVAESGDAELTVVVPEGSASLEMRTETTDGDPLGGMAYIMRINGILVPMEVKESMQDTGVPLRSDASGKVVLSHMPPGRYEIWPLASRADYLAATAALPPPAPVNVMLTPGHHVATLTFKPKG